MKFAAHHYEIRRSWKMPNQVFPAEWWQHLIADRFIAQKNYATISFPGGSFPGGYMPKRKQRLAIHQCFDIDNDQEISMRLLKPGSGLSEFSDLNWLTVATVRRNSPL